MADEAPEATEAPKAETPEPAVAQAENPDAVQNALKAERKTAREAAKRAEAAEARIREFEDADKSEIEKLTGKLSQSEQRAKEAEATLLRYQVGSAKGLDADLLPFLTGSTQEELERAADVLLEKIKQAEPKTEGFDGGAREPAPESKAPEEAHTDFLMEHVFGRPREPQP